MEKFIIKVPLPPSINHCYFYKNNIKIKKPQAREYWAFVERLVREEIISQNFERFKGSQKVRCNMWFYFPDNRRRDTHNTLKILLDALEDANLFEDDRYVLPNIVNFTVDRDNPGVILELYYDTTPPEAPELI
jgi:crossover junction endodeoxyribonuclease RusA